MAKFKTSALVSDIKGTVGGNVFASNKGGNYIRRYKKPVNTNTIAQQNVRNTFGTSSGNWRLLTEEQRQTWITGCVNFPYVDNLGQTKVYSGQQLFNSLNNNLAQIGAAPLLVCPLPVSFPDIAPETVTCTAATQNLLIKMTIGGSADVPAGFALIIEGTTSISAGVNSPKKGLFKKIAVEASATVTTTENLGGSYTALFGAIVEAEAFFVAYKLISTDSGEVAIAQNIKVIPAA